MKSLYDQCAPVAIEAAAILCGMEQASPEFRNVLRSTPACEAPERITCGGIARVFLSAKMAELCKISLDAGSK